MLQNDKTFFIFSLSSGFRRITEKQTGMMDFGQMYICKFL